MSMEELHIRLARAEGTLQEIKEMLSRKEKADEAHLHDSLDKSRRLAKLEIEKSHNWETHNREARERAAMYKEEFEKINENIFEMRQEFATMHNECLIRPPKCLEAIESRLNKKIVQTIAWVVGIPAFISGLVYTISVIHGMMTVVNK